MEGKGEGVMWDGGKGGGGDVGWRGRERGQCGMGGKGKGVMWNGRKGKGGDVGWRKRRRIMWDGGGGGGGGGDMK